jgi:uncharacterized protein YjiS (DUF1127 family)
VWSLATEFVRRRRFLRDLDELRRMEDRMLDDIGFTWRQVELMVRHAG